MEYVIIPWLCLVAVTMAHPILVALAFMVPFAVTSELSYRGRCSRWWSLGIGIAALVYVVVFAVGYFLLSEAMKGLH